jgi:two-component system, sensor histidine kinase and response regulator
MADLCNFPLMHKLFLILALLFLQLSALPQRKYIDSLLKIIPTQKQNPFEQINSYTELSYRYYQINTDSTLYYADIILQLSEKQKYRIGISMAYNRMGIAYQAKGNLYKSVLLYVDALKIAEAENNERWISSALNNLSYVYRQLSDYDKSKELVERSYILSIKNNNKRAQAINLTNLAWLNQQLKELKTGLNNAQKAIVLATEIGDDYHLAIANHVSGRIYLQGGQLDSAQHAFSKGLEAADRSGIVIQKAFNEVGLGKVNLQLGAYPQAIALLQSGYRQALGISALEVQEEALLALIDVYKKTNNAEGELKAYHSYMEVKDSLFNVNKQRVITRVQMDYDSEKKRNELLLNQKELALQKQLSYFLLAIALLLASSLYLIFRKNKTVNQKNQLLKVAYNDLQLQKVELLNQAEKLTANNKLRDRLFSILAHDLRSPMASLYQVIELLEHLTKEETRSAKELLLERFSSIDATLNSLLQWSKDQISGNESKTQVSVFNAVNSVVDLLQPIAVDKKLTIRCEIPRNHQVFASEQHVQILLRNLLSNAIKFSFVQSTIMVCSKEENGKTEISVADTGLGLSVEQQRNLFSAETHFSGVGTNKEKGVGLGLLLCKEIVEQYNGEIGVCSNLPQGLVVYFSLPTQP